MGAQVGKAVLATRTYQDASLQASLDALMVFAGASAYNAGFPEMVVPMVMQLKLFAKATQTPAEHYPQLQPVALQAAPRCET